MSEVTLVIPCYNEASRISLPDFRRALSDHPRLRLLFVDDGSTDETGKVLEGFRERFKDRITVLTQSPNAGKAEAVRVGMLHAFASGAFQAGYADADLATPLDEVMRLFDRLDARPMCVALYGSRVRLLGRQIERTVTRHFLGRLFATLASMTLRLPIYDTQCGAKCFRKDSAVLRALKEPFGSRWIFDVELIGRLSLELSRSGRTYDSSMVEEPLLIWKDVGGSRVKSTDFLRAVMELFNIYRSLRRADKSRVRPDLGLE